MRLSILLYASAVTATLLLPTSKFNCRKLGCPKGQDCLKGGLCVPQQLGANSEAAAVRGEDVLRLPPGDHPPPSGIYRTQSPDHSSASSEEQTYLQPTGIYKTQAPEHTPANLKVQDPQSVHLTLRKREIQTTSKVFHTPNTTNTPMPTPPSRPQLQCGPDWGNITCARDFKYGTCCSKYGFCGDGTAHCGWGCMSGPCIDENAGQGPGPRPAPLNSNPGEFKVVGLAGVPAMHAALMPNGKVVFLDKVENYTQIKFKNGYYAYSAEYDPATHTSAGLSVKTNAFCSGGSFLADGRLISLGGNGPLSELDPTVGSGFNAIRYLQRASTSAKLDGQPWEEPGHTLTSNRWYASSQILADGSLFVASGSLNGLQPVNASNNNPTYEILDAQGFGTGPSVIMEILDRSQPYYMYPILHLLKDGTMFVFVAKSSQLFDVGKGTILRHFPDLVGYYRTYPNTGGSVLLPLTSDSDWDPDILICGGGAWMSMDSPTDASCGRIRPLSEDANWELDSMPDGRSMVEGTLLPDGSVVWLNGCKLGGQGFEQATDPAFEALIYDPKQPLGERWTRGASSKIPRLYHSIALLLLDGTILVAGSNPYEMPVLKAPIHRSNHSFVTEFQVEIYTPPYLQGDKANRRPINIALSTKDLKADGSSFEIQYTAPYWAQDIKVALYHGGLVTHSIHMGHRMLFLDFEKKNLARPKRDLHPTTLKVKMPPNRNVAPPGPYVVYLVVDGVPGIGQFVMVG